MKNINNQNDCLIKKQGGRIQISFGTKTNLTEIREFISSNGKTIKDLQAKIISKKKINKEKRGRYAYNIFRDKEIYRLSKLSREELLNLINEKYNYKSQRYKDILIAEIINQNIKPNFFLGKDISPKKIEPENVRKIISRQKALNLKAKT
jgi:hypothetical protein